MKIADVFNEKSKENFQLENAKEYAYITAEQYTPADLLENEKFVLNKFNFQLYSPTTIHFLKLYQMFFEIDEETRILSEVYFIQ